MKPSHDFFDEVEWGLDVMLFTLRASMGVAQYAKYELL